jgi:hypothetical protein
MLPDSKLILRLDVDASTPTLAVGMAVWPNPKLGVDASRPNLELGVEASMPTSAQLGVGRGRGRVPQPEVGRAPRGSGAAIATQAFCQDPSARWRLGVPFALEPPKH